MQEIDGAFLMKAVSITKHVLSVFLSSSSFFGGKHLLKTQRNVISVYIFGHTIELVSTDVHLLTVYGAAWYHLLYSSLHGTGCGKADILVTQEKWDFGTTKDKGIYFSSLLFLENDRLITNILGIFYLY